MQGSNIPLSGTSWELSSELVSPDKPVSDTMVTIVQDSQLDGRTQAKCQSVGMTTSFTSMSSNSVYQPRTWLWLHKGISKQQRAVYSSVKPQAAVALRLPTVGPGDNKDMRLLTSVADQCTLALLPTVGHLGGGWPRLTPPLKQREFHKFNVPLSDYVAVGINASNEEQGGIVAH